MKKSDPATKNQKVPTGKGADVTKQVISDLKARSAVGEKKYGTVLRTNNGRDALTDLYQELLDACCYIRQELMERSEGVTVKASRPKSNILQKADVLTRGDRQSDYGHPFDDYSRTSDIWTAILKHKLRDGEQITPEDAVLCMVAVKMSREVNKPKEDNRVDMAGYVNCLQLINDRRNEERS